MVCATKEPRCECIVRDCSREAAKFEITLPASTPVNDLITQVAERMNYEPHSFQLVMHSSDSEITLTNKTSGSLVNCGLSTEPGARNSFILEGIGRSSKNLVAKAMYPDDGVISPPSPPDQLPSYPATASLRPTTSPAIEYTFSTPVIKHDTGYVGLVNQAMTCYLNSLLQALYMTPEFRNALYKWKFDEQQNPTKCIPFQLQKLFLNLQTSSKTAVETTELTRSFGWESGEVWQQHDIQELCRVMFDALEQEFKDTEQADLINQLYQGKMTDYVKCLECGTEKSRIDTFLDIPLPVRPFGSTIAYGSIEEALKAFVQPETLDGNNQYKCDKCEKKCDAHKGLKFTKFPYLLTLHLKRFDFDYNTLHRIKLNDKVVFPEVLDLNSFVECENSEGGGGGEANNEDVSIEADSVLEEEANQTAEPQNIEIDQEEDEGIDLSSNSINNHENDKKKQEEKSTGPYQYELYSIMIHSGSATGGHYYAYIKDFTRGEWYCFNDQSVTSITHEDIKKTYGGMGGSSRGYYSGAYSSSTNAYMLMYRQINKDLNCHAMVEEDFPPHIKKLLEELKKAEEREKEFRAKQEEMIKIKVHANHPMLGQARSSKLFCHNDNTVDEVKAHAYSNLKLEDFVPEDRCRLVSYNKSQEELEESLDQRGAEPISKVLSNLRYSSNYELLMEIRDKDKKFLPYNVGDIRLTVYIYDSEKQTVEGPQEIRTSPCQTLSDLKKLLLDYMPLKTDDVHLVLAKPKSLEYMNKNDLPLNKLGFSASNNKIFICYKGLEGDLSESFQNSEIYKFLDEVKNVITLQISLPDTKKETLELLLIPPLTPTKDNEKPSDSTPTGDGLPLTNGLQEEEQGYSSGGAGCTSDQSTSEDSSLTDSDRTIIGDVNECNLASPADCDPPFLLDSQVGIKSNQFNGEIDKWDAMSEQPVQHFYFMATPYTADSGQKMLRVVVDRSIDMTTFKKKLEKYIGVEHTFMKLLRGPEEQEFSCSLRSCRDHERITIKLERVLIDGEHRIKVNLLDLSNASAPDKYICDWIVCNGDLISTVKKEILREVDKRAGIKIPYERCRLRKQNWKNPGAVLHDDDTWDETCRTSSRLEVYLQELTGPEIATKPSHTLLFIRRWQPSSAVLGPFEEIVMDTSSPSSLSTKLAEISGIPVEHVKYAKGKAPFPGESCKSLSSDLPWETDVDAKHTRVDWDMGDGTIIFYRDDREEIKNPTKGEDASSSESTTTGNSTVSSYISGYSPKKERALKIYLDNTPRRSRSVVDVD